MERNFESYEDLSRNGQYLENTENQGVALQPVAALPPLSSFPKEQRQWNATVEQNILELRRTLTSVAKNVTIIGDNMATKADIQEIKELIRLG